jgi:hypothetical protein
VRDRPSGCCAATGALTAISDGEGREQAEPSAHGLIPVGQDEQSWQLSNLSRYAWVLVVDLTQINGRFELAIAVGHARIDPRDRSIIRAYDFTLM